jgi:hypothetical protein
MIFVAYLCLAFVFAVLLLRGGATFRLSRRFELLARLLGMIGAVAFASIAVLLLRANHGDGPMALLLTLVLLCGSITYLSGVALWREQVGLWLRFSGWFLVIAVLVVPSTLTLLLPVAALLTLTLCIEPEDRAASHARSSVMSGS